MPKNDPKLKAGIDRVREENEFLRFSQDYISKSVEVITRAVQLATQAKPIMIGPATLEALVSSEPSTYEYIQKEHLPFDIMFFEFPEPYKTGIPFSTEQGDLIGVLFYKSDNSKIGEYSAAMFFEDSSRAIHRVGMKFDPKTKAFFQGVAESKKASIKFSIDAIAKEVEYSTAEDMVAHYRSLNKEHKEIISETVPTRKCRYDQVENGEVFLQIANLCTNIVNYINAQNTTITKRMRSVDVLVRTDKGKKKKETRQMPYYIVTIAKREIEEPQIPTGTHWTLDERIVVRGHDRRYKDERGKIYMTVWIDSYVKGPENAPWRNQRYQVLGEAIERERRMMQ